MHKKESILKLGLVLFLICALVTLALAAANYITAPKIAAITEKQEKEARAEVDVYKRQVLWCDGIRKAQCNRGRVQQRSEKSAGTAAGYHTG